MSSGFVTETELAEARQKRQEEWEKVRQPDQPLERPEEEYDGRSLYERLKEQKDKKDFEFEEAHKLKNLIRGLDDDEVDFLDIIDRAKLDAEKKQQIEEKNELLDFRKRVASLQEKSLDHKITVESVKPKSKPAKMSNRPSQKSILSGLVRKREANDANGANVSNEESAVTQAKVPKQSSSPTKSNGDNVQDDVNVTTTGLETVSNESAEQLNKGALKCIGILPGIGKYTSSSESDRSTDTDDEYDFSDFDWVGRKIKKNCRGDSE